MVKCGFVKGQPSPCDFYHRERLISVTVHGDDFTSTGRERELGWMELELQENFEIKTEILGPDAARHKQEIRILNRVIAWTSDGMTYEADPRHSEIMIRELGLDSTKGGVSTPGAREEAAKASAVIVDDQGEVGNKANGDASGKLLSGSGSTQ